MDPLFTEPDEPCVLHVDDSDAFLDVATTYLTQEDSELRVISETNPHDALEHIVAGRVDCIVSDYDMPQADGLEFFEEVQNLDTDVPFILFTGKGSEAVAAEAIEAGIDSYLQKDGEPSTFTVLANRVGELVDRAWATRRAAKMKQTYELIARTATDAFWIRDIETERTLYSDGIQQFGYEPGVREDGFEWWVERVHPEDRDDSRNLNALQRQGATEGFDTISGEFGEFTHEYRWRCADGRYVNCTSRGIVRFEDDEPVEMVGAMTRHNDETDPNPETSR